MAYSYIDIPFSVHNPPFYKVSRQGKRIFIWSLTEDDLWQQDLVFSPGKPPPTNTEEVYRVLVEAFRALREQYGETLVFAKPTPATSFIYRSESALLLPDWNQRFAWMVHFYQVSCKKDGQYHDLAPERYGGFVFVRPWKAHLKAAGRNKRNDALCHKGVSPAVCEGYLRLRVSQNLSPTEIQIARNYGAPYDVDAFDSIPFYSPQIQKSCGYIALSAALTIAGRLRQYSPYELAAIHATMRLKEKGRVKTIKGKFFDNTTARFFGELNIEPIEVPAIISEIKCPDICGVAETIGTIPPKSDVIPEVLSKENIARLKHKKEKDWPTFWKNFTELLNCYVYQGLPVLLSVDATKLYSDRSDTDLLDESEGNIDTKQTNCHLILIHSLIRGTDSLQNDPAHSMYGISDTRNLHSTGSVFHKMTAKRLWAVAARPKAEVTRKNQYGFRPNRLIQYIAACVPKDFQLLWSDLKLNTPHSIHLRDRSQLRGFLISRIFNLEFLSSCASASISEEIRKFREKVRLHNLSHYVWFIERKEQDRIFGIMLDTRCKRIDTHKVKVLLRGVYIANERTKRLDVFEDLSAIQGPGFSGFRHSSLKRKVSTGSYSFVERSDATFDPDGLFADALSLFSPINVDDVEFAAGNDIRSIILQS